MTRTARRPVAGIYRRQIKMKKAILFAATVATTGLASAAPQSFFDAPKYAACEVHSVGAMQIAQESARRHEPVDALLNKQFDRPPVIDTKLAILAFDTITDTHSRPENESRLLGFLTGVCYASDIPLGELASKKQ